MDAARCGGIGANMLKRVTYQFNGEIRSRCFKVVDGELAPVECPAVPTAPTGIGDLISAGTRAVGVKPCGGCKRRQAWLNRWTPAWIRNILAKVKFQ